MKFLLKLLCLFLLILQPAFAANQLDSIANKALQGLSSSDKISIKNLELEMQISKQKRINSEQAYKIIQLEEELHNLSKGILTNQAETAYDQRLLTLDAMAAKNKKLTIILDKNKQQLVNQRELIADLKAQKQQVFEQENQELLAQQQAKNQALIDEQNQRYQALNARFKKLKTANKSLQNSSKKLKQAKNNLIRKNQNLAVKAKNQQQKIDEMQQKSESYQAQLKDAVAAEKAQKAQTAKATKAAKKAQAAVAAEKAEKAKTVKVAKKAKKAEKYKKAQAAAAAKKALKNQAKIDNTNAINSPDDTKSQFKLANDYSAKKNYKLALYWYLQVAEKGYASAQFNVGNMYYNGLGVDTDVAQAFAFYLQSAEQDFVEAQYNVGLMYSLGEGVLKDEIQSFYWHTKAAEQGHLEAKKALTKIQNNY